MAPLFQRSTCLRTSLLLLAALAAGCEKTAQNMYDQPRYKPLAESSLWADGRASRPPPDGAIAHSEGTLAGTSSGRLGVRTEPSPGRANGADRAVAGIATNSAAPQEQWTLAVLERGRERFDIFCAPCHSETGDGDGMIVRRGFPQPPSLYGARLRRASDGELYAVIAEGYGAMYPYAERISPDDRRAIVGYIRALQLSRDAKLADVPPEARGRLAGTP